MSECICMPAGDMYHGKKTHEVREYQSLGCEGSSFCFLYGVVKESLSKGNKGVSSVDI